MDSMSAEDAAAFLAVSTSRVRGLLRAGQLTGQKRDGRWYVTQASLELRGSMKRVDVLGPPLSPRMAWALAHLADGGDAPWLRPNERYRARQYLDRATDPLQIVNWLSRRAGHLVRAHRANGVRAEILAMKGVVATGHMVDSPGIPTVEVYASEADYQSLVDRGVVSPEPGDGANTIFRMVERDFHVVSSVHVPRVGRAAPQLVRAVDLMESGRAATGRKTVELILRQWGRDRVT